jgi:ATP-dependent DNA helicase RecQ
VLRATIAAGYVGLSSTEHPVPYLTQAGARVMKAEVPSDIVLREPRRRGGLRLPMPKPIRGERTRRSTDKEKRPAQVVDLAEVDAAVARRFEALRAARARLAKESSVPAYVVAHDRALWALAESAPQDLDAMGEVPGWGAAKVARWGETLLAALTD